MIEDRSNKPIHIGAAAARILERLKRTAGELTDAEVSRYDCEECKDTGLVAGKNGSKRCDHVKQAVRKQGKEKFF